MRSLIPLLLTAVLAGCASSTIDRAETSNKIELERSEYPPTIGDDYDPYEVAVFVRKRRDLAWKLYQENDLDGCIKVLQDLCLNIPSVVKQRYDLGVMLFQRASPLIIDHRKISDKIVELSNPDEVVVTGREAELERLFARLNDIQERLRPDTEEALKNFTIYSGAVPSDPRAIDMMWRCQLALGDMVSARNNLTRMISWEGILDEGQRQSYTVLRDSLDAYLQEANPRGVLAAPIPGRR